VCVSESVSVCVSGWVSNECRCVSVVYSYKIFEP
jgi:hypothetical protein